MPARPAPVDELNRRPELHGQLPNSPSTIVILPAARSDLLGWVSGEHAKTVSIGSLFELVVYAPDVQPSPSTEVRPAA